MEEAGLVFVGPTPDQLELFGVKHRAREAAARAGVPLLDGTGLLADAAEAVAAADDIGYPVMLKATGGGGGIGIIPCRSAEEVAVAFETATRVAGSGFRTSGVFLERLVERARHIEVQVVGDGLGDVVILGDRDCSLQRRNQKVVEEAPAPDLPETVRRDIAAASTRLARSVGLPFGRHRRVRLRPDPPPGGLPGGQHPAPGRAPGDRGGVERRPGRRHAPAGRWGRPRLVRTGRGLTVAVTRSRPASTPRTPRGSSDPVPAGITEAVFPHGVRVDGWVEAGTEVTAAYDPLLAKVVAWAGTRDQALDRLGAALAATRIGGIETNLGLVGSALDDPSVRAAVHSTATLAEMVDTRPRIEVLAGRHPDDGAGVARTPRLLARRGPAVGADGRPLLPARQPGAGEPGRGGRSGDHPRGSGPGLHRADPGVPGRGPVPATVDGVRSPPTEPVTVPAGATLDIGAVGPPGIRAYLLVDGGIDVPDYLGSAATFILGVFGGHGGPAAPARRRPPARAGRTRHRRPGRRPASRPTAAWPPTGSCPSCPGPTPTPSSSRRRTSTLLYSVAWEVHFNSDRTGLRLRRAPADLGPDRRRARPGSTRPTSTTPPTRWVRSTSPGTCPSCSGPDGPSLGGFVCPATVVTGRPVEARPAPPGRHRPLRAAPAPGAAGSAPAAATPARASWPATPEGDRARP